MRDADRDDSDTLHRAIVEAELSGNWAPAISLYLAAAEAQDQAEAFFLTHAYIHALETADPRAPALRARLVALGRETDLPEEGA